MNFNDVKTLAIDGPAMSFAQIAKEMGMSNEGVRLLYTKIIMKAVNNMTEDERNEINDLFATESSPYEDMLAAYAVSHGQEDLHGFWKEENNY